MDKDSRRNVFLWNSQDSQERHMRLGGGAAQKHQGGKEVEVKV